MKKYILLTIALFLLTACTLIQKTEDELPAIGREVIPTDEEYKHLEFLGQLFTVANSEGKNFESIFGVKGDIYTLGSSIYLKKSPTSSLLSTMKAVGYSCDENVEDSNCKTWSLTNTKIEITEILKLQPFADEFEKDDCINCG